MRFSCDFTLDKAIIPKDYRRKFLSYFKSALKAFAGGKYYDEIYGRQGKRHFSFSVRLPGSVFQGDSVILARNRVRLIFSTPDNGEYVTMFNALINGQGCPVVIGENTLTLTSLRMMREETLTKNAVDFKILSPICLRIHQREENKDAYVSVANPKFKDLLKNNINEQLRKYTPWLGKYVADLEIDTSLCKKTVVLHYDQYIETTIGIIGFKGEPALLAAIYKQSLGCRKASGFGLLQLNEEEEVKV